MYLRKELALLVVAAAACSHAAKQAQAPVPSAPTVALATPAPVRVDSSKVVGTDLPAAMEQGAKAEEADSAADQAALSALDSLELNTPDKNPSRSLERGTVNVPVSGAEVAGEAKGMFTASHGGTASTASPRFDIDVETYANHGRVQAYVDFFLGPARDRFTIWLGRMARYEGMARSRFHQQGIPEDMVYLGLIESGFSNSAVSRTKAIGMWQFMKGTAKLYGLNVNQWVDERRDPFKATDAAARLLGDLKSEFGSWYLAAAAYDAGSGRINRGLRRLHSDPDSGSDSMFFRLSDKRYLKRETRDYVPKLIAAALIAKEPGRYGFDSLTILPPLVYDEVSVTDETGMDVLARLADTTTAAILELNPQFFRGVTPPGETVIVRVPRGTGSNVALRWADLPGSERVTVIDHIVTRGETVSQIAHQYHVDAATIFAVNPQTRARALRVGMHLTIPLSPVARGNLKIASAAAASAPTHRAARASRPADPPAADSQAVAAEHDRFHVVRRGESLWVIARRYHVRINDLRSWNDLAEDDMLKPGERLIVAAPGSDTGP
jgi:membrane-bound lytic murein transglycosylase D